MRLLFQILFLFVSSWVLSQSNLPYQNESPENFQKKPIEIEGKANVLYANDFSNASQWSFSNTSVPSADWSIITNLNAAPVSAFQPAGFLTAFNGYAFINSDAQGPNATQDAIIQLNTVITACATKPFVVLRFSQMLRRFGDTTLVEVSNDGNTWIPYLCNPNLENNDNTPNPQKVDINISAVAGNQPTVYIRFRYKASNAWFWAIDDLKILEQDQFDLEGAESFFGTTGNWGIRMPYYQIPVEQIMPIEVSGRIINAGYEIQPNVYLTCTDGQGFSSQSDTVTIPANQSATQDIQDEWTPTSALGQKTLTSTAVSSATDQEPTNNTLNLIQLNISSKYYARSTDLRVGRVSNNFFQFGYQTGNIFDIFNDATISSAMVHVNSESTPGSKLFARLYEAVALDSFVLLSYSDTVIIPTLTTDQVFRVRLTVPTLLEAGKSYLLTAGSMGSASFPGLVIGTSGKSEIFTSYYQADNSAVWYSFTETPMVKMNFESVAELEENYVKESSFILAPNPNNGQFSLLINNYDLKEISNVEIRTMDGRILENIHSHLDENRLSIDMNNEPSGIYIVRISLNNNIFIVKQLIKI